ncbi:MAG: hypothetical protein RR342_04360 [Bacilli bacterium]
MKKKNIIISIVAGIAVLLTATAITGSVILIRITSTYVKIDYKDNGILLTSDHYCFTINYSEIKDLKVIGKINDSKMSDGLQWTNCEVGAYSCKELGRYYSYVYKSSTNSTLVTLSSNELVVIGLNSQKENTDLFNHLQSKIS